MGEYLYIDDEGHEVTITHRMLYTTGIICGTCGAEMWRRPQSPYVTWGGLPPSSGEMSPEIKNLIDTAPERRDKFAEVHEKHERDTEDV